MVLAGVAEMVVVSGIVGVHGGLVVMSGGW